MPRFAAYAAAFEEAYKSDEWEDLKEYFSEDAVYEVGLPTLGPERCEGRDSILSYLRDVLNRFDRRFETRELSILDGPKEENGEVWLRGEATYRAEGVPELVLVLEETARFEEGRIVHLEDVYTPEMKTEVEQYVKDHGSKLGLVVNLN